MALFTALAISVSCTKDGGGDGGNEALIGRWEAVKTRTIWDNGSEHTSENIPGECFWVFEKDGTFKQFGDGDHYLNVEMEYKVKGSELHIYGGGRWSRTLSIVRVDSEELVVSETEKDEGRSYTDERYFKKSN